MANKASTANDTIEIVCRGVGCNTGTGKFPPVKVPDGGHNTTLDELVILASKGPDFGWNWYRYHVMCVRGGILLTGNPEDAAKLVMTVAEVIEQHGPIKMIGVIGSMRGDGSHLTGSTMLESIRINAAAAAAAAKKEEDGDDDANKKSETVLVGGVSFDDVDGDTSTLRVSTSSSSDGSDVLSWCAGGHCLIESVSSLRFDPDDMTLTCPQPILPTPFTNGRVWNTLVAVLNPGTDTNELLGRIRTMLSEATTEVALEGFP